MRLAQACLGFVVEFGGFFGVCWFLVGLLVLILGSSLGGWLVFVVWLILLDVGSRFVIELWV